jgi:DNA-binding response OmpR family regulator
VLKVLVVGPNSLTGTLGPTVLARPDIDRVHVEKADAALEAAEEARPHMVVIDRPSPSSAGSAGTRRPAPRRSSG